MSANTLMQKNLAMQGQSSLKHLPQQNNQLYANKALENKSPPKYYNVG